MTALKEALQATQAKLATLKAERDEAEEVSEAGIVSVGGGRGRHCRMFSHRQA